MNSHWKVGILLYDQMDVFDFVAPYEVLNHTTAGSDNALTLWMEPRREEDQPFVARTVSKDLAPVRGSHGLQKKNYPQVLIDMSQRVVDEGNIVTSGGVTAGLDLGSTLSSDSLATMLRHRLRKPWSIFIMNNRCHIEKTSPN